jgi:hypothetical protein
VRIRIRLTSKYREIGNDIVALLQAARSASTQSVNALMTATYWEIGCRIVGSEQQGSSGRNTERLLLSNSLKIWSLVWRGFGWRNLTQMRTFFPALLALKILQTPSTKSAPLPELAQKLPLPW